MKILEKVKKELLNKDYDFQSEFWTDDMLCMFEDIVNATEKVVKNNAVDKQKKVLPGFLYVNSDYEIAIGCQGDTVVTDEWEEYLLGL